MTPEAEPDEANGKDMSSIRDIEQAIERDAISAIMQVTTLFYA